MHEAVRELEGQPFTNLRQEEVEEKYSNLMVRRFMWLGVVSSTSSLMYIYIYIMH